jgi:hypothetical protein
MTAPSYTTNLNTLDQAESNSSWVEFTGTSTNGFDFNIQGSPQGADADWPFIQNTYAVTQTCTSTKTGYASLGYDNGASIGGHGTDGAYFVWQLFANPNFDSYANDGLMVLVGDAVNSFYAWTVGGNDVGVGLYLGWQNHVVNVTVSPDDSCGSYAGSGEEIVGAAAKTTTGIGKGEPHAVDVIRYGRGDAVFEYGESANYATIAGFAAQNDSINNRWGLIQAVAGGYLWKGLMQLGSASNPVDFRDSNRIIFIQWCPKVTANFNTVEIVNTSSNIEMTGFQFICLEPSTNASKGRWITTNDATVVLTDCSFIDMSTFVFDSNTTISGGVFRRCGQVTQAGADLDGCTFSNCTDAVSLLCDNPDNVDDCTFVSDGSNHAIRLTAACAGNSYTLTNLWVSGYATSDGSTGNEVIYNDSGGAVTINIDGGSGVSNISVRNGSGASTTLVANYSFIITGLELNTEVTIVTAGTSTELFHAENATTSDGEGKYQVTYSHSGGASVDILIHHVDYQPDVNNTYGLTLPSSNSSIKVSMFEDLNYENP